MSAQLQLFGEVVEAPTPEPGKVEDFPEVPDDEEGNTDDDGQEEEDE